VIKDLLISAAHAKKITFKVRIDKSVLNNIISDSGRIRKILVNLIRNAIKFTEKDRMLLSVSTIKIWPDNHAINFDVTNTGIGV
jgi:signal transduction histidine kinase